MMLPFPPHPPASSLVHLFDELRDAVLDELLRGEEEVELLWLGLDLFGKNGRFERRVASAHGRVQDVHRVLELIERERCARDDAVDAHFRLLQHRSGFSDDRRALLGMELSGDRLAHLDHLLRDPAERRAVAGDDRLPNLTEIRRERIEVVLHHHLTDERRDYSARSKHSVHRRLDGEDGVGRCWRLFPRLRQENLNIFVQGVTTLHESMKAVFSKKIIDVCSESIACVKSSK